MAVIGGGWSGERAVSLRSQAGVVQALRERGWAVDAIDLLPERGRPRPAAPKGVAPVRLGALLPRLRRRPGTVAFLCLHGPYGEDGRLQGLLEMAGLPFTGSGSLASALAMDKPLAKALVAAAGVRVPGGAALRRGQPLPPLRGPVVVKPASQGSALGVTLARTRSQALAGLKAAWRLDPVALVEPWLRGRELTVGVLGGRALPVVEIRPRHAFYDYHSKYAPGGSRHLCPAPIPARAASQAQAAALKAHRALGCRAFSRSDFILDRAGRSWFLELNTLPGLTSVSLLPDAAKAAGLDYPQLLEAMLRHSREEA